MVKCFPEFFKKLLLHYPSTDPYLLQGCILVVHQVNLCLYVWLVYLFVSNKRKNVRPIFGNSKFFTGRNLKLLTTNKNFGNAQLYFFK